MGLAAVQGDQKLLTIRRRKVPLINRSKIERLTIAVEIRVRRTHGTLRLSICIDVCRGTALANLLHGAAVYLSCTQSLLGGLRMRRHRKYNDSEGDAGICA